MDLNALHDQVVSLLAPFSFGKPLLLVLECLGTLLSISSLLMAVLPASLKSALQAAESNSVLGWVWKLLERFSFIPAPQDPPPPQA